MDENLNLEGNAEIEKALKEFEAKSQAEQVQKAPEVSKNSDIPKIVGWVIKLSGGAIKEERQAEYVLLGFVIVAIGVSLYLVFGFGHKQTQITPTMIEQMKKSILLSPPKQ